MSYRCTTKKTWTIRKVPCLQHSVSSRARCSPTLDVGLIPHRAQPSKRRWQSSLEAVCHRNRGAPFSTVCQCNRSHTQDSTTIIRLEGTDAENEFVTLFSSTGSPSEKRDRDGPTIDEMRDVSDHSEVEDMFAEFDELKSHQMLDDTDFENVKDERNIIRGYGRRMNGTAGCGQSSTFLPLIDDLFNPRHEAVFTSYCEHRGDLSFARAQFYTHTEQSLPHSAGRLDAIAASSHANRKVDVLINALLTSARQTLITLRSPLLRQKSFQLRARCLYSVSRFHAEELARDKSLMKLFDEEVDELRNPMNWPSRMRFDYLRLLLWRSDREKTKAVIHDYKQKYSEINYANYRVIAYRCLKVGLVGDAMWFLQRLPKHILEDPTQEILKLAAGLLQGDGVIESDGEVNFHRLPALLKAGLKPDNLLYARIIQNSLDAGYAGVAWDLHRHVKSLSSTPQPRIYLILLKYAFENKEMSRVNALMSEIHQNKALYTNAQIVAYTMNMVRVVCFVTGHNGDTLSHLLAIYDRGFRRGPLTKLGIVPSKLEERDENALIEPPASLIAFAIHAYLLSQTSAVFASLLWKRLTAALDDREPAVVEAMKLDVVYNALLIVYSRSSTTLHNGLEIVQRMLEGNLCMPTARTWSILICGFLQHDHHDEAVRVLTLMRSHGVTAGELLSTHLPPHIALQNAKEKISQVLGEHDMPQGLDDIAGMPTLSIDQTFRSGSG